MNTIQREKKKGIDGKACWKGYRYAGTENGKDKCVKISEYKALNKLSDYLKKQKVEEAEYQGRKVKLNKPMRGDTGKFKVYVNTGKKNADGTIQVKKVNFGAKGKKNRICFIHIDKPKRNKGKII